jgi:hypothetical protein
VEQRIVREEEESVSEPSFGKIRAGEKRVLDPLGYFGAARWTNSSGSSSSEEPPQESRFWIIAGS